MIELSATQHQIVLAMLAQMGLTFALLIPLPVARIAAIRSKQVKRTENGQPIFPKWATQVSDCFNNQFQVPMLFHAVCLLTLWLHAETDRMVWLAWAFFALRVGHAAVFITVNFVPLRFLLFVVSTVLVLSMWLQLVGAVVNG